MDLSKANELKQVLAKNPFGYFCFLILRAFRNAFGPSVDTIEKHMEPRLDEKKLKTQSKLVLCYTRSVTSEKNWEIGPGLDIERPLFALGDWPLNKGLHTSDGGFRADLENAEPVLTFAHSDRLLKKVIMWQKGKGAMPQRPLG